MCFSRVSQRAARDGLGPQESLFCLTVLRVCVCSRCCVSCAAQTLQVYASERYCNVHYQRQDAHRLSVVQHPCVPHRLLCPFAIVGLEMLQQTLSLDWNLVIGLWRGEQVLAERVLVARQDSVVVLLPVVCDAARFQHEGRHSSRVLQLFPLAAWAEIAHLLDEASPRRDALPFPVPLDIGHDVAHRCSRWLAAWQANRQAISNTQSHECGSLLFASLGSLVAIAENCAAQQHGHDSAVLLSQRVHLPRFPPPAAADSITLPSQFLFFLLLLPLLLLLLLLFCLWLSFLAARLRGLKALDKLVDALLCFAELGDAV